MKFQGTREQLAARYEKEFGEAPTNEIMRFMIHLGKFYREAYEEGYAAGLAARNEEEAE